MNISEKPVFHLIVRFKVGVGARGSAVDPAGGVYSTPQTPS